jgi:hypothetical protein
MSDAGGRRGSHVQRQHRLLEGHRTTEALGAFLNLNFAGLGPESSRSPKTRDEALPMDVIYLKYGF